MKHLHCLNLIFEHQQPDKRSRLKRVNYRPVEPGNELQSFFVWSHNVSGSLLPHLHHHPHRLRRHHLPRRHHHHPPRPLPHLPLHLRDYLYSLLNLGGTNLIWYLTLSYNHARVLFSPHLGSPPQRLWCPCLTSATFSFFLWCIHQAAQRKVCECRPRFKTDYAWSNSKLANGEEKTKQKKEPIWRNVASCLVIPLLGCLCLLICASSSACHPSSGELLRPCW